MYDHLRSYGLCMFWFRMQTNINIRRGHGVYTDNWWWRVENAYLLVYFYIWSERERERRGVLSELSASSLSTRLGWKSTRQEEERDASTCCHPTDLHMIHINIKYSRISYLIFLQMEEERTKKNNSINTIFPNDICKKPHFLKSPLWNLVEKWIIAYK